MSSSPSESFHRGLIEQRTKENVTVNVEPIKRFAADTACKLMAFPAAALQCASKGIHMIARRNCVYILVCTLCRLIMRSALPALTMPERAIVSPPERLSSSASPFFALSACMAAPPHSLLYRQTTAIRLANNQHSFAYRTICIVVRGVHCNRT